jgi:hypothetical protein
LTSLLVLSFDFALQVDEFRLQVQYTSGPELVEFSEDEGFIIGIASDPGSECWVAIANMAQLFFCVWRHLRISVVRRILKAVTAKKEAATISQVMHSPLICILQAVASVASCA